MTILEAMASGLPVIASEGQYLPTSKVIKNSVTGELFKVGDVNKLSEAITQVLTNKKLAEKLGKNAR